MMLLYGGLDVCSMSAGGDYSTALCQCRWLVMPPHHVCPPALASPPPEPITEDHTLGSAVGVNNCEQTLLKMWCIMLDFRVREDIAFEGGLMDGNDLRECTTKMDKKVKPYVLK